MPQTDGVKPVDGSFDMHLRCGELLIDKEILIGVIGYQRYRSPNI